MANAWHAKCTPPLASSTSSVASSVQVPSHIGTNNGYCLQVCDVRQSQFQASAMTQVSSSSSIPCLSPYTSHLDTGNPFFSLLSVPSPQVQSDFQHPLNVSVSNRSYPDSLSSATFHSSSNSIPSQHLTHYPKDYNGASAVDVCPLFPPRFLASSKRSGIHVPQKVQDCVKSVVPQAGSVHIDARCVNIMQKGYMGSSNASKSSYRMPHGSNMSSIKQSPPGVSSFHHDHHSTFMCSFRVFCMNKSGDLQLSNTGLLAVVCSCHGTCMSVSNFCEHSGITNVIPGYAVHMGTGETLAQWRMKYFSKLGIRVPEDNKGWEWPPTEHLSTFDNSRRSAPSVEGIKRSVYSNMVGTLVEPENARRLYDKVLAGYPYVSQNQMPVVSQNNHPGNSSNLHSIFSASSSFSPESSLHNMVSDSVNVCPNPNASILMKSRGLLNGRQLSSKSCNMNPEIGNLFSQSLGGLLVKTRANEKISAVSEPGGTSSSIELKLGQPSEKCRSLESSLQRSYNNPLTSPPWETGCQQYAQFGTVLSSSCRKEKQSESSKYGYVSSSIANSFSNIEALDNDLSRHSKLLVRPISLATSSGAVSREEITKRPTDSHHYIPSTRHSQHPTSKSGLSCIDDGTSSPLSACLPLSKFACVGSTNKNLMAGNTKINSLTPSETHFQLHANQMEKMVSFNRDTPENNQYSSVDVKNQLPSKVPHISKLSEESGERLSSVRQHVDLSSSRIVIPSMGFRTTFPSEDCPPEMPLATADLADHLKTVLPNKEEACFGPNNMDESLRKVYLVDQTEQDETSTIYLSNKHRKLQNAGPDFKLGASLLNLLPSERLVGNSSITNKSSLPELTSTSFSPVLSHQCNKHVEARSSTSVLDNHPCANIKKPATQRSGLSSFNEEMSKHCHGCHDPQENKLLLEGAGNQAALLVTYKNSSHGGGNSRKCSCNCCMLSSNKGSAHGDTISARCLNKNSPSSEAIDICESGINLGYVQENKSSLLAEKEMVKSLVLEELSSSISQLREVPAKIKEVHEMTCINEAVHKVGRRGESGAEFKDFSAENDPWASKIDESLMKKELSNFPSGGSAPAIQEVSVEVNTPDTSSIYAEDPVCGSDRVVDQGSSVGKCFLTNETSISQTSSRPLSSSSGKVQSTRSCFSNSLDDSDSHDHVNEQKRKVGSHGLAYVKRKRRTKWKTQYTYPPSSVALTPSAFPSGRGDPALQQYHSAKWTNRALSSLQTCSRKRYLDIEYDNRTMEHNSKTDLNSGPNCDNLPNIIAVKKLKHNNSNEEASKLSLQKVDVNNAGASYPSGLEEANCDKQKYLQGSGIKPIVCGMYGIISGTENILRLPKIFSLSKVLKTARKFEVKPPLISLKESKKSSLDGRFSSTREGRGSRFQKFRQPSSSGMFLRGDDKTSLVAGCSYDATGCSAKNKQGLEKTKSNASMSSISTPVQFKKKVKAVRQRSLYEIFMEGERSSSHMEIPNDTSALPEQCTYEMKTNKKLDNLCGDNSERSMGLKGKHLFSYNLPCCICGKSSEGKANCLLECCQCLISIHQACYGISMLPKGRWYCRPCSTNSFDIDLLHRESIGTGIEKIGSYKRCMPHAIPLDGQNEPDLDTIKLGGRREPTCARTEGYKGRKQDGKRYNAPFRSNGKGRRLVAQEQLDAWFHINRKKLSLKPSQYSSVPVAEYDYKKEYVRYKQTKGWKQLVVYKSGIHALGLYSPQLIPRGAMVVEYVGEVVGPRVADKREKEYQSGRKLQYKSACYFFRIDKEHIVDATRKGGIARFVNHSCMPNCVAKIISVRNEKKVVFFSQRDIYPGEEITYDYHFSNEDEGEKIPCFCNSRNCRQFLN